jgi:hypothetical protein
METPLVSQLKTGRHCMYDNRLFSPDDAVTTDCCRTPRTRTSQDRGGMPASPDWPYHLQLQNVYAAAHTTAALNVPDSGTIRT